MGVGIGVYLKSFFCIGVGVAIGIGVENWLQAFGKAFAAAFHKVSTPIPIPTPTPINKRRNCLLL